MFTKKFAIIFIASVLAVFASVLTFDFGFNLTWVDIPLHFTGGMAVAMATAIFFKGELGSVKFRRLFIILILVGSSAFVGTLWEFMEWGIDHLWGTKNGWQLNQPSLDDTMFDYLMDLSGGFLVSLIYLRRRN